MQENITLRQAEDYLDYAENNNLDVDIYNLMRHVLGINYYIPVHVQIGTRSLTVKAVDS